ncbi:MAG: hypothetical protein IGS03_15430 [Candidatus Sericytochromatia bacterium]|nr:hypothetical protein [Candidatus Sericytochromatia bacterium]
MRRHLMPLLSAALLAACTAPMAFGPQGSAPVFQRNNAPVAEHQLVSIRYTSEAQLFELSASGMDVFGRDHEKQTLQARLSPAQIARLREQGIEVLVQPFQAQAQERAPMPPGYMTYQQMVPRLQAMAQAYPQLVRLQDVGDTWEKTQGQANHDIWMVHLSNHTNRNRKPAYLMVGGMHARELAPVEILFKLMDLLTGQYGKDPRITQLLDTRDVIFLPMVNVDGRVQVERGSAWHRKNTHGPGVDLNRNFDNHWNYQGLDVPNSWKQGLSDPNGQIYSGTGPASEPETQVVQAMFHRFKPVLAVDMHAHGDMMLWPLGYSKSDAPHAAAFKSLFARTVQQLGFKGGTSAQILYPTTATTRDYAYEQHGAISMTLEIGDSFRPNYSEVERMWQRLQPHLLTFLETPGLNE